ncbi:MAG: hypothetical protein ACK4UU_09320, partial [Fimbriimonadales bacterium]
MRRLLFALTCWATVCAWTQQTILDPEQDSRLERRVSVRLVAEPLFEVIRALSEQSGVVMTVAQPIAEYRATVVVKDRPLHEVMTRLQQAFDFRWERNGNPPDEFRYRFYQPDAQREAERRAYAALRERWKLRLRNFIERHRELLAEGNLTELRRRLQSERSEGRTLSEPPTEAQLRQLFDRSPFSVYPPGPMQLAFAYMAFQGGEAFIERIARGEPIVVSPRNPATRQLAPPDFQKLWAEDERGDLQAVSEETHSPHSHQILEELERRIQRIENA